MSELSAIEWTDATWNPVTGCTKVSPGCAHCYIERTPPFRMAGRRFVKGAIPVLLHPDRLDAPLRWRKPRRVFVCSLADLFHDGVPDAFIDRVFATMALAPQHTFQVLTKRPERMRAYFAPGQFRDVRVVDVALEMKPDANLNRSVPTWPLPNVWLGVSVENQRMADERIPVLLDTPAAVRFLSCEPLLGPLDLTLWMWALGETAPPLTAYVTRDMAIDAGDPSLEGQPDAFQPAREDWQPIPPGYPRIDWVIVGGESGPGRAERKLVERCAGPGWHWKGGPTLAGQGIYCKECAGTGWRPKPAALEWLRDIRDQCVAAGVPFFFKQFGGLRPPSAGRLLDGQEWSQLPDA